MKRSLRNRRVSSPGLSSVIACVLGIAFASPAWADRENSSRLPVGARPADIQALAARIQRTFNVPGMAVAIVKDGKVLVAHGYGVRAVGDPATVDADTLFGIGSNTKAFTVAALAMLVDEGKLHWDDKVIDHLPGFRLYDPYVTRELTVRDLLTHRSGLGLGSGDLMLFPSSDFTRAEIIHNLRFLPPASSFRSKFAYDNLLYIVAGELIPAITGISWETFVQTHILDRIGSGCIATRSLVAKTANVAAPHVLIDGSVTPVAPDTSTAYDAAGSIQCNANGMAAWANVQLSGGRLADGGVLFTAAQHKEMWTPQTIEQVSVEAAAENHTHFRDYGLGWTVEDYMGALRVTHTGGLIGMVSYVSLLPEQHVGIVVLTNQQSGAAMSAMMQTLLDRFVGGAGSDRVAFWARKAAEDSAKSMSADRSADAKVHDAGGHSLLPLAAYVGVYHDPWRGDATVSRHGD